MCWLDPKGDFFHGVFSARTFIMKLVAAAALFAGIPFSDEGVLAGAGDDVPFEAALKDADIRLSTLASPQRESLIVGNGDLYGIVWQKDGGLYMRVTKNDIWDARIDTSQDPPLPRVDIHNNSVSGELRAPPSYRFPYPQPRCAAAIRIGRETATGGVTWTSVRGAASHQFQSTPDRANATMTVAGAGGASTGYRATLTETVRASALHLKIKGSANALYYVNVYNKDAQNILASGWQKSPESAKDVLLTFAGQAISQVEVYTQTSDGETAVNQLDAIYLSSNDTKTDIKFPARSSAKGSLDLHRAVVTVDQPDQPETRIRVLADRNVILIRTPEPVALEPISAKTLPEAQTGRTNGIAWLLMKMPGDLDYAGMQYALAVAGRENLKAISVVTSFDIESGDVLQRAMTLAAQTLLENEANLIARHEHSWHEFWSRSGVELENRDLQRWWYRILYFARTISRPGASPPGLMPPLATDATPWHADFHFNYNSWQPFWSVVSPNHPELADSWISYVHDLLPRAKWLASKGFGCEGVFYSISQFLHEPDPAVCRSKNKRQIHMNPWGLTIGMVGMTAQSLWHKHLCDPDRDYLEAKIYPTLREAARFYVSFMAQCHKDESGKVVLGPSYSPEHGRFGIANCPFDIAYVHYTFAAFIRASGELGRDQELAARCREMKDLLPDYPTALNASGQPVVVDWEGCQYGQVGVHNITVPAAPVFPAEQVTWFSPEPVKTLFRRTIEETRFNGNNSHIMFNIAKARLSMPDAVTAAHSWFKSRELPNGLFVWQGHAHGTFITESIGIAALITEFLMQSVDDTIRVFPCWPQDQDARFANLRAQGGFLVSAEQKGGRVTRISVTSTAGGTLRLLSPWPNISVARAGATRPLTPDPRGIIALETRQSERLEFTHSQ